MSTTVWSNEVVTLVSNIDTEICSQCLVISNKISIFGATESMKVSQSQDKDTLRYQYCYLIILFCGFFEMKTKYLFCTSIQQSIDMG